LKIIKLDTINSTNSYLRELAIHQDVDNFTVVSAKHQSEGKGQIDKKWITEPNKNLTFSILIKEKYQIQHKKYINIAVSLALHDWFTQKKINNLSIKWPNDIMAGSKKLSGILIETMIRGSKIYHTVIGIGINVNQQQFSSEIKSASSLLLETSKTYDLDLLLLEILPIIQNRIQDFLSGKFKELEEAYSKLLYRKDIPSNFVDNQGNRFAGSITGISQDGNLLISTENGSVREFGIKEVAFA
jgi:BirA family biotin operon repressor/biotin-[acetyl-CoA-carboxylase] ligase